MVANFVPRMIAQKLKQGFSVRLVRGPRHRVSLSLIRVNAARGTLSPQLIILNENTVKRSECVSFGSRWGCLFRSRNDSGGQVADKEPHGVRGKREESSWRVVPRLVLSAARKTSTSCRIVCRPGRNPLSPCSSPYPHTVSPYTEIAEKCSVVSASLYIRPERRRSIFRRFYPLLYG